MLLNMNDNFPRMHVSLYVKDLEKTVNFYNKFFGQNPEKVKDKYVKYILNEPSLIISFIENEERVQANFGHLGFQVETKEELYSKLEIAKEQGIVSLEEIGTNCCFAEQDKFWATDPDGIQWEVYYFHKDVEFNDPKYSDGTSSECCMPEENKEEKKKLKLVEVKDDASVCVPGSGCC
jgi:catechol-2,3-dioxygenase